MQYLSDEWLVEADKLVREIEPLQSRLVIAFHTLGGPSGDRKHAIVLGPDQVEVRSEHSQPDVTLTLSWEHAVAIATGEQSAQRAFLDGTMTLSGDAATLLGNQDALKNVSDKMSQLRADTSYA